MLRWQDFYAKMAGFLCQDGRISMLRWQDLSRTEVLPFLAKCHKAISSLRKDIVSGCQYFCLFLEPVTQACQSK